VAFYLGIDGGGTKTRCAVGDETSLLATVTSGPSNITRVGEARARESLHYVIREACAAAKIDPRQIQRACAGVAGAGREESTRVVKAIVAELIRGEIEVAGDMPIALEAAFGAGPGVIVISGTGSIAYGRNGQGKTARAGGWGFAISDEGSAHWIGRTAVSKFLRAWDKESSAEETDFFRGLKDAWKLHSLEEVVRGANSNPDFAALFAAIMAAADAGDVIAQDVLTQAGRELAELAKIVAHGLFEQGDVNWEGFPVAMAGGVFSHSQCVRRVFCEEIRKLDSHLEVSPQIVAPVEGALQIARHGRSAPAGLSSFA
jgi:glucosamine kinase